MFELPEFCLRRGKRGMRLLVLLQFQTVHVVEIP